MVNISSTSGMFGNAGQINYATAKAGVVGIAKTMAKDGVDIMLTSTRRIWTH